MREGWRRLPLGRVAYLDIDRVVVEAHRSYPIAGVLNAGSGLFSREQLNGSATNYPALHRLHSGQLVMRKLTAWEGPITTVDEEYDGCFVSPEFPTFTLDRDALEPSYMCLICQTPTLWEAMKNASTGTVQRRKRVSPSALLSISLDIPPLPEQQRIVHLIESVDQAVARVRNVEAAAATVRSSLTEACWKTGHPKKQLRTLGRTVTGSTPATKVAEYWSPGEVPFVTPGDMSGLVVSSTQRMVSAAGAAVVRALREGAVAQVCIGSVGKVSLIACRAVTNQQINAIEGLDRSDAMLLVCLLGSPTGQGIVTDAAGKTTLPILKKSLWEQIEVPWPGHAERVTLAGLLERSL